MHVQRNRQYLCLLVPQPDALFSPSFHVWYRHRHYRPVPEPRCPIRQHGQVEQRRRQNASDHASAGSTCVIPAHIHTAILYVGHMCTHAEKHTPTCDRVQPNTNITLGDRRLSRFAHGFIVFVDRDGVYLHDPGAAVPVVSGDDVAEVVYGRVESGPARTHKRAHARAVATCA